MIKITDLTYVYPGEENPALDKVTLNIEEGSFTALLGPNGSGKSTLIQLICGLISPFNGEITVDSLSVKDEEDIWDIRRKLAITFQNPDNQIVGSTVERDIAFGLENLGLPRGEIFKRIEEVIGLTGLSPVRFFEPHNLSEGQKQKLALAGILAMKPKYLLLDEPAAMLDYSSKEEILSLLTKINRDFGTSIFISTHSLDLALKADKIIILENGKLREEFGKEKVSENFEKISEKGIELPYWAKQAVNLQKDIHLKDFYDLKTFGEALCSSLKK